MIKQFLFLSVVFMLLSGCYLQPKPEALKLNLPEDTKTAAGSEKLKNNITLILLANDKIYEYEGTEVSTGAQHDYSAIDTLLAKGLKKYRDSLMVIVEPSAESNYKSVVDVLDKIKLNNIGKYALVDLPAEDSAFIKNLH